MFSLKPLLFLTQAWIVLFSFDLTYGLTKYDKKDLENLREEVRQMFQHAYDSYLNYAYPYDELRPLSCDGVDTWGSYSLTLIDALDTLAVMGNYTEFQRVVNIVTANANFDANINVSVFETNIRIIGGLLSAHLLSHRAGVNVVPGWPCNGPLLELAEDVARRLIAAFDTPTGMPYGTVNLQHGVPVGETTVTCTAGVGTFILELGTLSRLTGDPLFEEVALTALDALHAHRSSLGLVGNHVDVATGRWTAQDAGIGAGVDSYYEYLAKGAILLQRPELMHMFNEGKSAIEKYLKRDDWHLWVSMSKGQVTLPVFQSLEAYWPGVLSLTGEINKGMKSLHNYHQVWKQYGFTPEFYYIPQGEVGTNRESYPLRPELIESVMYLYRATGDPYLIEVGKDILRSIQHSAKTPCGYATIKDVRDHRKEDRMESFFLAETTKYLYLLFDPDNFLHNQGQSGTVVHTPWGECVVGAGGYIFNTEAHPIDPGALHCCSGPRQVDIQEILRGTANTNDFKGIPLSTHQKSKRGPVLKKTWETKSFVTKDTFPPTQPETVSSLHEQLDLISKAQIEKHVNSMLPAQQHNEQGTKEAVMASTGSEMVDTSRESKKDDFSRIVLDELGGAINVIQLIDQLNRGELQIDGKNSKLVEPEGKENSDGAVGRSANLEDPRVAVQDDLFDARLGSLLEGLKEKLNKLRDGKSSIHPEVLAEQEGKNSGSHHIIGEEIDPADQKILDTLDLNILLYDAKNMPHLPLSKLELYHIKKVADNAVKEASVKSEASNSDALAYQADDSDNLYSDESSGYQSEHQPENDNTGSETSSAPAESSCTDDRSAGSADTWPSNGQQADGQTSAENESPLDGVCGQEGGEHEGLGGSEYILPLSSVKIKFNPQDLFERLQTETRYKRNSSWVKDHEILSCTAQPFLQRLSMSGEMFEVP